jgi:hypothetical protein
MKVQVICMCADVFDRQMGSFFVVVCSDYHQPVAAICVGPMVQRVGAGDTVRASRRSPPTNQNYVAVQLRKGERRGVDPITQCPLGRSRSDQFPAHLGIGCVLFPSRDKASSPRAEAAAATHASRITALRHICVGKLRFAVNDAHPSRSTAGGT